MTTTMKLKNHQMKQSFVFAGKGKTQSLADVLFLYKFQFKL